MGLIYETLTAAQNVSMPDTFTVDHNKLTSVFAFRQTRYSDKLFYSDVQAELNVLISVLAASDGIPKQVFKMESPDFKVIRRDNSTVYVEVTTAIASAEARADNVIAELNFVLSTWSHEDSSAATKIAGYAFTFFMHRPPSAVAADSAIAEMQRFILMTNLEELSSSGIQKIPRDFPVLHELEVQTLCLHRGVTFVQVSRGAMSVESPAASTRVIAEAIARKRGKAENWPQPLWLLVWISGHYYSPDEMLKSFRLHEGAIAPFRRIYIGGAKTVLLIREGQTLDDP